MTRPELVSNWSDGRGEPGFSHVTGNRDWDWFFNSTDRKDFYHAYTPRQTAEQCGGMIVSHPGGRFAPMRMDQFSITQGQYEIDRGPLRARSVNYGTLATPLKLKAFFAQAGNNPSADDLLAYMQSHRDEDLRNAANLNEFIEAASAYKRAGYWLGFYMGGGELPGTFDVLLHESPKEWARRAEVALAPILMITPQIDWLGIDHLLGYDDPTDPHLRIVGGAKGGLSILCKKLRRKGIEIGIEPFAFQRATWLHDYGSVSNDSWHDAVAARGWLGRNNFRALERLLKPLDHGEKPFVFARRALRGLPTDAERWAYIDHWQERGYGVIFLGMRWPGPRKN